VTLMMDEFDEGDIVVDDMIAVDEFGDPTAEVAMDEVTTFDADGNEEVLYEFTEIPE